MKTQVAIIGGGPSGLLLSQLLHLEGIDSVVLERRSREHVLSRIRAGVLEEGTARLLERAGVGDRLKREGRVHEGVWIAAGEEITRVDFRKLVNGAVTVFGQTEVTADLYAARDAMGGRIVHGAEDVAPEGLDTERPHVTFRAEAEERRLECDYVAGCDGFHGVSRGRIPKSARREYEKVYPFAWLGILSRTRPLRDELVYSKSDRGFALCSMRREDLSRHYIQVPAADSVDGWGDEAFWGELRKRLPRELAESLETGPSIEKSMAPLRSFVSEPMQWGRLFLCGDAAHIVPPTGAKGLNLALSDALCLSEALADFYGKGDAQALSSYSERSLRRVWRSVRFSWWMTTLLHSFPGGTEFEAKMRRVELEQVMDSVRSRAALAESYTGMLCV